VTFLWVAACEWCEVEMTSPLPFPWEDQERLEQDVTDDCPVEATQAYLAFPYHVL
jgi:hypothetical protein